MNAIITLYRILLRLFPLSFRDEFGDEMQSVFAELLTEKAANGLPSLAWTILSELGSLPSAALRQCLASWFTQNPRPAGWEGPPTRRESLLALAVCPARPGTLRLGPDGLNGHRFMSWLSCS
jgi:hypothetical protein